jgi:hypothetical protein
MFDRNPSNVPRSSKASSIASVASSCINSLKTKSAGKSCDHEEEELAKHPHHLTDIGNEETYLNLVLFSRSPTRMKDNNNNSNSSLHLPPSQSRSQHEHPSALQLQYLPPTLLVQHPPYHDYANITMEGMKQQHYLRESSHTNNSSSHSKSKTTKMPPSHARHALQEKFESSLLPSFKSNRTKTFPVSIHELLTFVDHHPTPYYFETIQQSICPGDIIRWEPHGRSFTIYNRTLFAQCLLPIFFPYQNEYAS